MKQIDFTWPTGFSSDGIGIGLGTKPLDFGWLVSEVPAAAAGAYTTNQFCAAPTALTKQAINQNHQLQALVMNSVIANSCTGQQGQQAAQQEQALVARKLGIDPQLVGVASTGVIGQTLPMAKITAGIERLQKTNSDAITKAILTTDTQPKTVSYQVEIAGQLITVSGFCKGSGMIHPKMATMLGFICTDAAISGADLQTILSQEIEQTFNQITVDGDSSTNDMVVCLANGQAGGAVIKLGTAAATTFQAVLHQVMADLAKAIAKDGEGATKLVEVNVTQAATTTGARQIAKAIVGSNLVKAALFGQDANWGRVIAAIGATPVPIDPMLVNLTLNGYLVFEHGTGVAFDEATLTEALAADKIVIEVQLGQGTATGQAWGCDLTYEYVQINASYRS